MVRRKKTKSDDEILEDNNAEEVKAKTMQEAENTESVEETDEENVTLLPLTYDELYASLLNRICLPQENENSELHKVYADYFGEDFQIKDLPNDINDKRMRAVAADYLNIRINRIKDQSISLDPLSINDAMAGINDLIGISQSAVEDLSKDDYDKIVGLRIANIKELTQMYDVYNLGRDILNKASIEGLAAVSQIDMENKTHQAEVYHHEGIINSEQMAKFYYNMALVNELRNPANVTRNGNSLSGGYMKKALELTQDVTLVKACYDRMPDWKGNKQSLIGNALDKILRNSTNNTEIGKAHMLYAKNVISKDISGVFSRKKDIEYQEAMYHYNEAFKFAATNEEKTSVLRSMAKLQKKFDRKGYTQTSIVLAGNFMSGKNKVKELIGIAAYTDDKKLKKELLESAVNELVDTADIKTGERSLLLKNIGNNLRGLYTPEEKDKISVLSSLEKKYCIDDNVMNNMPLRKISSKGNDYFH